MPGFGALLDKFDNDRRASVISQFSTTSTAHSEPKDVDVVLFPAAFGVAAGQHFDDGSVGWERSNEAQC